MRPFLVLAAIGILAASAAPAVAAQTAEDFQLYVLRDLDLNGNNISRRVAVGGNATFTSTSIGGATADLPGSLVVGGDLIYLNGGSINGGALVGGTKTAPAYLPITTGVSSLPVDFDVENLRLTNLSATLAGLTANGTVQVQGNSLRLTGLDSGLNVFTISAATLSSARSFGSTSIASGSQVLINVTGDEVNLHGGLNFYDAPNILWNFSQATTITAGSLSLSGSILAPNATFTGVNGGTIGGDLIVGDFKGAMSFSGGGYQGALLRPAISAAESVQNAVPEPGVWTMLILGFGAVGAVLRRRRAALAV